MHTIKITPNLLFEYQCTSGKFIKLPNRIEKNRFVSENHIESKLFLPELECSNRHIKKTTVFGGTYLLILSLMISVTTRCEICVSCNKIISGPPDVLYIVHQFLLFFVQKCVNILSVVITLCPLTRRVLDYIERLQKFSTNTD